MQSTNHLAELKAPYDTSGKGGIVSRVMSLPHQTRKKDALFAVAFSGTSSGILVVAVAFSGTSSGNMFVGVM
eukprot:1143518-Pelagomonas_calceolata.AAC.1